MSVLFRLRLKNLRREPRRSSLRRKLSCFFLIAVGCPQLLLSTAAFADQKGDRLQPNQSLHGSTSDFIASPSFSSRLIMQADCNLVLYHGGKAVWSSDTYGHGNGCRADMQGDGNLVVYRGANEVMWASNTDGNPGAYVISQNDGNVVLYRSGHTDSGNALWATNTLFPKPTSQQSGTGSSSHPGCRFSRTDTKCEVAVQFCKAIWSCGFDGNFNEKTQDDGWSVCGACLGLPFSEKPPGAGPAQH